MGEFFIFGMMISLGYILISANFSWLRVENIYLLILTIL